MLFSLSVTEKTLAMEIFYYIVVVKVQWTFSLTYISVFHLHIRLQQTRHIYKLFSFTWQMVAYLGFDNGSARWRQ
jgi:hypothetical protein